MQPPLLENEKIQQAKLAIKTATSENLIERCRKYLLVLDAFRNELYKFRGSAETNRELCDSVSREAVEKLRKQIRAAVEKTTRERNKIEELLKSFVTISGYEALETLNICNYKGHINWELKAGGANFSGGTKADQISVQEAVTAASLLRRREYLASQTNFGTKQYEQVG